MSSTFLARENTVAGPGFNRLWSRPRPRGAFVHGQAYAFSTFNLRSPAHWAHAIAPADWNLKDVGWIFSIAIVFLGSSAAVSDAGSSASARECRCLCQRCVSLEGSLVSAVGIHLHQLWIIYLGYGVLGGCGLGIGYISPVSTLIKWFPDRPGMATGMAIMGFGGGALIAAPCRCC